MNGHVANVAPNSDPLLLEAIANSLCQAGAGVVADERSFLSEGALRVGQLELNLPGLQYLNPANVGVGSEQQGNKPARKVASHFSKVEPRGIIFADMDGRVQGANRQAISLLEGGDGRRLLGKSVFDLVSPKDRARLRAEAASVLQDRILHHGEYSLIDASGQVRRTGLSVAVMHTVHHETNGLLMLLPDISEHKRTEKRMGELQTILNQALEAVLICDLAGRIHYMNQEAGRLFGWSREELNQRTLRELFFEGKADFEAVARELRGPGKWAGELRLRSKTGEPFMAEARLMRVNRGEEQSDCVVVVASDVTERKRTEESLKQRELLSQEIIKTALNGFWMVDLNGLLLDVNDAYCRMCGYGRSELLNRHISELEINESSRKAVASHIKLLIERGYDRFETQHRHKDGHVIDLEVSATYLNLGRPCLFAFLNDVTERKRLERQERDFSRQIVEAQEAERARMGRELHDGVNQIIASAKMRLRKLDERPGTLGPALREVLSRCDQLLLRALNENRRIAQDLHPSELSEFGLAEACRGLCREAESHTSMVVKSELPKRWRRLSPAVELNLFRIAQEGLRNVEQHAHAKSVRLRLGFERNGIIMKITDDGRGFDPKSIKKARSAKHGVGLVNIRERATVMGGTCAILSVPRRGTTITIRVPRETAVDEKPPRAF